MKIKSNHHPQREDLLLECVVHLHTSEELCKLPNEHSQIGLYGLGLFAATYHAIQQQIVRLSTHLRGRRQLIRWWQARQNRTCTLKSTVKHLPTRSSSLITLSRLMAMIWFKSSFDLKLPVFEFSLFLFCYVLLHLVVILVIWLPKLILFYI